MDKNGVVGAPIILLFRALFDRGPGRPSEADVSITALGFREITAKASESKYMILDLLFMYKYRFKSTFCRIMSGI